MKVADVLESASEDTGTMSRQPILQLCLGLLDQDAAQPASDTRCEPLPFVLMSAVIESIPVDSQCYL